MQHTLHLGEMLKARLADNPTQIEEELGVFDIGALVPIMEELKRRYELELLSIGNSARYHTRTNNGDTRTFETGEGVYEECQIAFKRLQDLDTDFRKINTAIGIITKLGNKYLV